MILDPALVLALQYFLALMLFAAATHKLAQSEAFRESLAGYGIVPDRYLSSATILLAATELLLAAALLLSLVFRFSAVAIAALLAFYAGMMIWAKATGRGDHGCGCNWGQGKSEISTWMVWRNVLFVTLALIVALAAVSRSADLFDHLNAAAAATVLFICQISLEQLLIHADSRRTLGVR